MLSPFSSKAASSERLISLAQGMRHDIKIILPMIDKYGVSEKNKVFYFPIKNKSFIKLLPYVIKSLIFIRKEEPDLVYFIKPHLFTFISAVFYKSINTKCKIAFDCDEWDPATLKDNNAPFYQILTTEILAKLSFKFADKIIYSNELIKKEKIPQKYWNKSFYLPNGVDSKLFKAVKKESNEFNLIFVGLLYKINHIISIIDAVDELSKKIDKVRCYIIGDGPKRRELEEIVMKKNLRKYFIFTGMVNHHDLPNFIKLGDVLIAPFSDLGSIRYQSNVKIFEYMASGKPIVASDVGEIKRLLAGGKAGYIVPPGNSKALADAIMKIYKDKNGAKIKSAYARELVEKKYDWRILAKNLSNYLVN